MEKEIILLLVGATVSFVPTLIVTIFNYFMENKKEERRRRSELVDKIYDEKLCAYKNIYAAFVELHELLNVPASDLLMDGDYRELNITQSLKRVKTIFSEFRIYYNKKDEMLFAALIYSIDNLNDMLPINCVDGLNTRDIVEVAREQVTELNNCFKLIKGSIGLNQLNEEIKVY